MMLTQQPPHTSSPSPATHTGVPSQNSSNMFDPNFIRAPDAPGESSAVPSTPLFNTSAPPTPTTTAPVSAKGNDGNNNDDNDNSYNSNQSHYPHNNNSNNNGPSMHSGNSTPAAPTFNSSNRHSSYNNSNNGSNNNNNSGYTNHSNNNNNSNNDDGNNIRSYIANNPSNNGTNSGSVHNSAGTFPAASVVTSIISATVSAAQQYASPLSRQSSMNGFSSTNGASEEFVRADLDSRGMRNLISPGFDSTVQNIQKACNAAATPITPPSGYAQGHGASGFSLGRTPMPVSTPRTPSSLSNETTNTTYPQQSQLQPQQVVRPPPASAIKAKPMQLSREGSSLAQRRRAKKEASMNGSASPDIDTVGSGISPASSHSSLSISPNGSDNDVSNHSNGTTFGTGKYYAAQSSSSLPYNGSVNGNSNNGRSNSSSSSSSSSSTTSTTHADYDMDTMCTDVLLAIARSPPVTSAKSSFAFPSPPKGNNGNGNNKSNNNNNIIPIPGKQMFAAPGTVPPRGYSPISAVVKGKHFEYSVNHNNTTVGSYYQQSSSQQPHDYGQKSYYHEQHRQQQQQENNRTSSRRPAVKDLKPAALTVSTEKQDRAANKKPRRLLTNGSDEDHVRASAGKGKTARKALSSQKKRTTNDIVGQRQGNGKVVTVEVDSNGKKIRRTRRSSLMEELAHLSPEQLVEWKKEKNRQAAKDCRVKRKVFSKNLKDRANALHLKNMELQREKEHILAKIQDALRN